MREWLSNSSNVPQSPEQREGNTIREIHDILGINHISPIDTAWPNKLVPQWLIYNEVSGKIFDYLKSKWIKFYLDSEKKTGMWYSHRAGKYIFLWLKTPRLYIKNMWIWDTFDENEKTQIVFLHEMCHHLTWELLQNNGSFQELKKMCLSLRRQRPKNWATELPDTKFYYERWLNEQATEDCVELLRIYFMYRKNESECFECIKHKLNIPDDTACKKMFNLLAESVMYSFPTW